MAISTKAALYTDLDMRKDLMDRFVSQDPRVAAPPVITTQREMLEAEKQRIFETIQLSGELVHQFAEDAEHLSNTATRLNAAAYRLSIAYLPFSPGELQMIATVAKLLRTKGVEIGDAMAAGYVRKETRCFANPAAPLSKE